MTSPMCEKLNLSFCRYVLGVHRMAQSSAVRGELGRFPLGIDIVGNITKYYEYLLTKEEGTIMHEAFKLGNELAGLYPNQTRLWHGRYSIMKQALSPGDRDTFSKKKALALSRAIYVDEWNLCINREAKMRTYKLFKSNFGREPYLSIKSVKQRKAMAAF